MMPRESVLAAFRIEGERVSTGDAASHRTTSTVRTAAAGKGAGNRSISTTTYPHLTELVKQGFLPPRSDLLWFPADKIEDVLKPDSCNRVMHTSFLYRGLSLPLHSFFAWPPSLLWLPATSRLVSSPSVNASWGSRHILGFGTTSLRGRCRGKMTLFHTTGKLLYMYVYTIHTEGGD
jgi:hypothetical protein